VLYGEQVEDFRQSFDWLTSFTASCYAILPEVKAGSRAIPSAVELLTALPVLSLPE